MNIYSRKRLKVVSQRPPVFPLSKRRKHIQEALVKETGWNDKVEGFEQRGVLSVGRDVCYTTDCQTQPYGMRSRHSSPEYEYMIKWPISTEIFVVSQKELFCSLILSFPSEIDYTTTIDSRRIH